MLKRLSIGNQALSGPLPELYKLTKLSECDISLGDSDYCLDWQALAINSICILENVPECSSECMVLYEWIKISPGNCCSTPGITCDIAKRIIEMYDIYLTF
jgi:hypothetical protein